jgi:hypothetical protein
MQRVTIHAGANKTGSSAIQAFLAQNSHQLRLQGVVIPDESLDATGYVAGNHVWYFDQEITSVPEQTTEVCSKLEGLLAGEGVKQVVISAENLGTIENSAFRWFQRAASRFPLEVVIYLRRQDDLFLSSWQQWFVKAYPDFWTWALSAVGRVGDWRSILERWESVVGRERMRVRLYEVGRLRDDDAVADFCEFLDVDTDVLEFRQDRLVNPSFDEAVVDLVRSGGFFEDGHDAGFFEFLESLVGASAYRKPNESSLTHEQRMAIIDRYADSNAWVREAYFADRDVPETLFTLPQADEHLVPSPQELMRRQIQLIARCLYELDRRGAGETSAAEKYRDSD